jgi:hypothetical protein
MMILEEICENVKNESKFCFREYFKVFVFEHVIVLLVVLMQHDIDICTVSPVSRCKKKRQWFCIINV